MLHFMVCFCFFVKDFWAMVGFCFFVELSLRTGSFGLTGCDGTNAFSCFEQHMANIIPIKQDPAQCDAVLGTTEN